MRAPVVIFLSWVGTKVATAVVSAAASKLVSIPVDKALGIQVQGASVGAWAQTAVLAGQSLKLVVAENERDVLKYFGKAPTRPDGLGGG